MDNNQPPGTDGILSNIRINSGNNSGRHGIIIDKDLVRLDIAYRTLRYVILGTGIIILITLAADIFLAFSKTAGQTPDVVDHVVRIGGLTIPLISFILGHIFGKSQG